MLGGPYTTDYSILGTILSSPLQYLRIKARDTDHPSRRSCSKKSSRSGNFISKRRSSCDSAVFFWAPGPLKPSKPSGVVGRDGVGAEGLRAWSPSEGCRISPPDDLMGIDCAGNLTSLKPSSLNPAPLNATPCMHVLFNPSSPTTLKPEC